MKASHAMVFYAIFFTVVLAVTAGFQNVYALKGNFGAWADAGYPVEN